MRKKGIYIQRDYSGHFRFQKDTLVDKVAFFLTGGISILATIAVIGEITGLTDMFIETL